MDFHCLVRKDLQALCKLNKIPANRTNIAMAEALSSLQIVKGIEKFCKSTDSSVAESSVESPEKNVVTSTKTSNGRRKQVREGSGMVQTITPFTRRKNRVPVASVKTVQRVYNTRLSARLSKKELVESAKKECVEAVKISSYCDVVSDNDFGEVFEEKNISGSDNVGVEASVFEIEQESESLKWKDVVKDLDSRNTAATNMKSKVLEDNGLQVDTVEAVLEMTSDDNMAVVDMQLHTKKDDVGVDLCLSQTDILTEVLANEGSDNVGVDYCPSEIEHSKESQNSKYTDRDMDLKHTAETNLKPEVLANKGSNNVGVESSVFEIEGESKCLKWRDAVKDLDSRDTAATNMKSKVLENNGLQMDTVEADLEMPSDDNMAVVDMQLHDKKDDVVADSSLSKVDMATEVPANEVFDDVGADFSFLENELLIESSKKENEKILDNDAIGSTNVKGEILCSKGSNNVGVSFDLSEIEETESRNWNNDDEELDAKDTAANNLKSEVLIDKDDVVVDKSLPEIDMTTEVLAHEVELLTIDTQKAVVEMPIHETKAVEQVFSPQEKGSDNVGVHFTFLEGSDNVGVHFSFLETDENVDASVTRSTDSKESGSLKEQLEMESCEKVNCGERVQNLLIQPKSENVVFECYSSTVNNCVDGENLDISVEIQQNISCNKESDLVYDNEKGLASQEVVSGKAIGDDNSADTDYFQLNICSMQSDSKRKLVSEILICNGAVEFADQFEMTGSTEVTNDFSGGVTFVDESCDKDRLADDPESSSEAFDDNSCDTEARFDFLEYAKQQDRKRESIASQILCGSYTKEPADQSDSFDSSVGFSSAVASYHQFVSGNSLTKESGLRVASDVSYCCSGMKKMSFDESPQASEVKCPSPLKLSGQIYPSSAPPILQYRKAKITDSVPPLILADYPFTERFMSSGVRSLGPCNFANTANYKPVLVSSTTIGPTFMLKSEVSDDKENIEQNESKVELTKDKAYNKKNEIPVCKKSDAELHLRSPRRLAKILN